MDSTKRTMVINKLVEMFTDGKHGDKLTREEAIWFIENRKSFSDEDLADAIGAATVEPFKKLCGIIGA